MVGGHVRVCRHALSPPGSEVLELPRAVDSAPLQRAAVLTRPQLEHQTAPADAHGLGEAPADDIHPPPADGLCGGACMAPWEPPLGSVVVEQQASRPASSR